jgi:hypothetical protein
MADLSSIIERNSAIASATEAVPATQLREPRPQPIHIAPPPGEELAAEPEREPGAADDVRHERVAGDEAAPRKRDRQRAQVDLVARERLGSGKSRAATRSMWAR